MYAARSALLALSCLATGLCAGPGTVDQEELVKAVDGLVSHYEKIGKQIDQLKALLGRDGHLDRLEPLQATSDHSERTRIRMQDGCKAFELGEYEKAKESFQLAWESAPEDSVSQFNLGLAYYHLGNIPLAKTMLKGALDVDAGLANADKVRLFVEGEDLAAKALDADELNPKLKNEMINLRKEAESYVRARDLSFGAKVRASVDVLERMQELAHDKLALQREFYLSMAETYADFEMFQRALSLLKDYEKSMDGKVLPDGYHGKLLHMEERSKALDDELSDYIGNLPNKSLRRNLKRDLNELEIFALQMDEFVQEPTSTDPDFAKIGRRLGEFKWGKRPNRHVMVVDRYSELLYSSLKGTLPVERYQDAGGRKFLKRITQLADRMDLKQSEYLEVDLNVNGSVVPYVVMYTYIPKHQAFIIVRLPREELL